jgi:hypothetical protein
MLIEFNIIHGLMYADEIIRQVTVKCPNRGSMLIRVRDEIIENLNRYQKLFESVTAYGIRKSLIVINRAIST